MIFHISSVVDYEIKALFTALVLYRRAFATDLHPECDPSSTLLSPSPSPTLTTRSVNYARMLLELRKALGDRVFEDNDTNVDGEGEVDMKGGYDASRVLRLEDARDRVASITVDVERGISTPDNTPSDFCFLAFI